MLGPERVGPTRPGEHDQLGRRRTRCSSFRSTSAPDAPPIAIAAGGYHSCAVLDDGTAKCWGANGSGNLGQGDTTTRGDGAGEMGDGLDAIDLGTGRTAITVAAGLEHTCAVLDDGTAKCWGQNAFGQLGRFNTSDIGDGAGEMGDSLAAIDLGTGRTATALAGGTDHSSALLDSRALRCWGGNGQGQLGQGDTIARGDNVAEMGFLLPVRLAGNSHVSPVIDVPLPPTDVAAVAGVASATVTWEMPEDNGGRPIQGFRVQSAPAGTSTWSTRIVSTGSLATNALVTGLDAAAVQFRVAAISVIGASAYSSPSAAVVPAPVPAAPLLPGPVGTDLVTVPPARLLDTRGPDSTVDGLSSGGGLAPAGSVTEVQVTGRGGVPGDAGGAILNVTVVGADVAGFATVFGCTDTIPTASNLNYSSGQTIANNTVVELSPTGSVCVYTDAAAHLLVDVNGYLPAGSHVGTVAPARLLDTRGPSSTIDGLHAGGGPAAAGSVTEVQITGRGGVPADAIAAILNVTVVGPAGDGFATIFPCLPVPPTASNLNYTGRTRHPQRRRRPAVAAGDGVCLHPRVRPSPDRRQRVPPRRYVGGNARSGATARHPGPELHRRRPALRRRTGAGWLRHRGSDHRTRWRPPERNRPRSSMSPSSAPTPTGSPPRSIPRPSCRRPATSTTRPVATSPTTRSPSCRRPAPCASTPMPPRICSSMSTGTRDAA